MLFLMKHAASYERQTSDRLPCIYRPRTHKSTSCGPPFAAPIPTYYRNFINLQIICEGPRKLQHRTISTQFHYHRTKLHGRLISSRDPRTRQRRHSDSAFNFHGQYDQYDVLLSEDVRRNFQIGCL